MYKYFSALLIPAVALLLGATFSDTPIKDQHETALEEAEVGLIQQLFLLKKLKPDVKRVGIIWKEGISKQDSKLETAKRAAASIKGKLFVGYAEKASDVAEQFRLLTRDHNVQALWIIENDGVVDGSTSKQYLIENAVKEGIPLLAPTSDWVDAGAPLSIAKSDGELELMINEPAAAATGLEVPSEYESQATPVVAAN
jgi:putative ABC transport system substrate-binding protein